MTTKEKILKTALKLFAKQGIAKTSTAQITKEVGIAEGTLFVHFKTKQALVDSIYLDIKQRSILKFCSLLKEDGSAEENVRIIAKNITEYFLKNYEELIFMEIVDKDPIISKVVMDIAKEGYAPLVKMMRKWRDQGDFKRVDLEFLQAVIWNLIMLTVKDCKVKNKKSVSKTQIDLIWDAIKK